MIRNVRREKIRASPLRTREPLLSRSSLLHRLTMDEMPNPAAPPGCGASSTGGADAAGSFGDVSSGFDIYFGRSLQFAAVAIQIRAMKRLEPGGQYEHTDICSMYLICLSAEYFYAMEEEEEEESGGGEWDKSEALSDEKV